MSRRAVEIAGFLTQKGWDSAQPIPIDADLSPRRYARLEDSNGRRAILMDADEDQKTLQFVALSGVLRQCGISAPDIIEADPMRGLALMEDFGDRNFGRMIDKGAERRPLYRRAVDVLIQLHQTFDRSMTRDIELPRFGTDLFTSQAELFLDAYIPYVKDRETTAEERESFRAAWKSILKNIEVLPQTLLLRDFMPDNLMDLPNREGVAATGVLDFQDAGIGTIAYDLASLCEVVRRYGGDALLGEMIAYYHEKAYPTVSTSELTHACHVLATQRHIRILGIITRHALKTGRKEKLEWLPRAKRHVTGLLSDKALEPLRQWMEHYSPLD